ncbi:MAG: hypothetical protein P8R54_02905 [Myxococcota bacterium]|nr:hypothetical protein [Myxococcota bacterium]
MKKPLPVSVVIALGLTAGCQDCGSPHVGPCLSAIEESSSTPPALDEIKVMHCLSDAPDTGTVVRPCLEFIPEPEPDEEPQPPSEKGEGDDPGDGARRLPSRSEAVERVLAQGMLPEDVVALIRARQRENA